MKNAITSVHAEPEVAGALFQVASQFNLQEMTRPSITPEHRVSRYSSDPSPPSIG